MPMGYLIAPILSAILMMNILTARSEDSLHISLSSDEAFLVRHPWTCIGVSGFYDYENGIKQSSDCGEQQIIFRQNHSILLIYTDGTRRDGVWHLDSGSKNQNTLEIIPYSGVAIKFIPFFYVKQDRLNLVEAFSHKTELKKVRSYERSRTEVIR